MRMHHCRSGEGAHLGATRTANTVALARAPFLQAFHLVVCTGQTFSTHHVAGSMTANCIEGHVRFEGSTLPELWTDDGLFLEPRSPHAMHAIADNSLLLTILFNAAREKQAVDETG